MVFRLSYWLPFIIFGGVSSILYIRILWIIWRNRRAKNFSSFFYKVCLSQVWRRLLTVYEPFATGSTRHGVYFSLHVPWSLLQRSSEIQWNVWLKKISFSCQMCSCKVFVTAMLDRMALLTEWFDLASRHLFLHLLLSVRTGFRNSRHFRSSILSGLRA